MIDSSIDFLVSLIKNDSVCVGVKAENWEDSIYKCFAGLLKKKIVTANYIDEIIKSTKKHGPYYIICPFVAMPHTNPKYGSVANAFSLITLSKPVYFSEQPIKLLIGFCAIDDKNHLEIALPQICAVFENEEAVKKIINAGSKTEIIQIIKEIDYMKYLR